MTNGHKSMSMGTDMFPIRLYDSKIFLDIGAG